MRGSASGELSADAIRLQSVLEYYYNHRPVSAIEIAQKLELDPQRNRESRRRSVRFLADELRGEGHRVCAGNDGYWLARTDGEWHKYLESAKNKLKFGFVKTRERTTASSERATGQGKLFETRPCVG